MKPLNKRALRILQSKLRHQNPKLYHTGDYWAICATPIEIIALIDIYNVIHHESAFSVEQSRNQIRRGEMDSEWFYFHAGPDRMNAIFGNKKHERRRHEHK